MDNINKTQIINEDNLSVAWAKAFLRSISQSKEIIPLIVMVNDLNNDSGWEDMEIRRILDNYLKKMGKQSCNTVANTIFPESLWNPKAGKEQLYERYFQILPLIRKCPKNKYGVYFERLIAYDSKEDSANRLNKSNQLETIIGNYNSRKGVRRSVLQTSIFDPMRDHSNRAYLSFPCLQHITFAPCGDGHNMTVNGFYAMQHLFERAYGNYLGLYYLGQFVAHELRLELNQINCMVGIGKLEVYNNHIKKLAERIEKILVNLEHK
jgi:thymidylate synthase